MHDQADCAETVLKSSKTFLVSDFAALVSDPSPLSCARKILLHSTFTGSEASKHTVPV
jgi:hypothetical protein